MAEKLPYTGTLARQHDPDRFFLTLLQPASVRSALWALLAFNYEVAKTREVVSEPTLGFMRLQWWREALERVYAEADAPAHEVLAPLAAAIRTHDLPFGLFDQLITAREFDLEKATPESVEELKRYIAGTVTPLTLLMLKICGQPEEGAAQISEAWGITGIMRSIPYQARQGRCFVPVSLATMDELFRDADKSRSALIALHNEAAQALVDAGTFRAAMLKHMGYAVHMHLRAMDRRGYNVRDQNFSAPPAFFHLRMWWAR